MGLFLGIAFIIIMFCVVILMQCNDIERIEKELKDEVYGLAVENKVLIAQKEAADKRFRNYVKYISNNVYYDKQNDTIVLLENLSEVGVFNV